MAGGVNDPDDLIVSAFKAFDEEGDNILCFYCIYLSIKRFNPPPPNKTKQNKKSKIYQLQNTKHIIVKVLFFSNIVFLNCFNDLVIVGIWS